jgi:hypothetical protein
VKGLLLIQLLGSLAEGDKGADPGAGHVLLLATDRSDLGRLIALGQAMEFLVRARQNLGVLPWSEAAIEVAQAQGAAQILIDTLSDSPAALARAAGTLQSGQGPPPQSLIDALGQALHESLRDNTGPQYAELPWEVQNTYRTAALAVVARLAKDGLIP